MESINKTLSGLAGREDFQKRMSAMKAQIMKNPDIQKFLSEHRTEINDEMINRSLIKLYEYIGQSKRCADCPSLSECKNLVEGYHPKLILQGKTIDLKYEVCPMKEAEDERKKHQALIKSMFIPRDILNAKLEDIDLKEDSRIRVVNMVLSFSEEYEAGKHVKGMYLYGSFGVGKTYILGAIANELAKKKIPSMLVYVPEFMRELKSSLHDNSLEDKIDVVKKVKVLMLDDIGAEAMSSWIRDDILGSILQYRMLENLPTFFTSNFSMKDLQSHLSVTQRGEEEPVKSARIMERIKYLADPYELKGRNWRER
ncbi:primosomal protein DnaI [Bacillus sp. V2I10]|uniref:primosomal protein DnaI n=1 Tax=Bacillus sp. V2I10 TaxID=3042276 RepID=UPI0027873DDE|nr:primosomal protein DnaI [Bacillus sp. V2I10]MDQ0858131.1 primosomal protein DnaI [Bacillus sp. V2I10]